MVDLCLHGGHFHMAQSADLASAFAVKQKTQKLQFRGGQGGYDVYSEQEACLVGLDPLEFAENLGGQFRTQWTLVKIGVADTLQNLLGGAFLIR